MDTLTVDDLLIGSGTTYEVAIPAAVLRPTEGEGPDVGRVVLRPLVLADIQRIHKAAHDSLELTSVLMVQQSLVEPKLSVDQTNRLHAGLVQFLLGEVNRVSGLALSSDELESAVQAPLARACFTLSREFGWTPDECAGLTIGQVLLYLEMLGREMLGREMPGREIVGREMPGRGESWKAAG
ncbi:hypothetical protein BH18ACT4_BH18ACT4_08430 [soil metagenome]